MHLARFESKQEPISIPFLLRFQGGIALVFRLGSYAGLLASFVKGEVGAVLQWQSHCGSDHFTGAFVNLLPFWEL